MPATIAPRTLYSGSVIPARSMPLDNAQKSKRESRARDSRFQVRIPGLTACVFARFRAADDQLAAEEFLVVQLGYRSLRLVHRLHLHKSEALGALIVFIAHDFRVLDVADTVEEIKEVALCGIE